MPLDLTHGPPKNEEGSWKSDEAPKGKAGLISTLENTWGNNVLLQVGFGSSISDSNDQSGIIVTRKTLPIKIRVLKYIKTRKMMKHTLLYVRPQMIPTRLHMSQTVRGCV